jgi:hypothetical protein
MKKKVNAYHYHIKGLKHISYARILYIHSIHIPHTLNMITRPNYIGTLNC